MNNNALVEGFDPDELVTIPRALLAELADDLEAELWENHPVHPRNAGSLQVEMEPVRRARRHLETKKTQIGES